MKQNNQQTRLKVFDYRALRLIVGCIALALPWIVCLIADDVLYSISHSYYTSARDVFVGLMSVVAAFLIAYNGHSFRQACFATLAGVAALGIAWFPTEKCLDCQLGFQGVVHNVSALVLFLTLAYFCIGPFRENLNTNEKKPALRSKIYLLCGGLMILSILSIMITPKAISIKYDVIFWAETIALSAFGVAWMVAGKYFSVLVDKHEKLILFNDK